MKKQLVFNHLINVDKSKKESVPWMVIICPTIEEIMTEKTTSAVKGKHVLTMIGSKNKESLFHGFIIDYTPPDCNIVILNWLSSKDKIATDKWYVSTHKLALPLVQRRLFDLEIGTLLILNRSLLIVKEKAESYSKIAYLPVEKNDHLIKEKNEVIVWAVDMTKVTIHFP